MWVHAFCLNGPEDKYTYWMGVVEAELVAIQRLTRVSKIACLQAQDLSSREANGTSTVCAELLCGTVTLARVPHYA